MALLARPPFPPCSQRVPESYLDLGKVLMVPNQVGVERNWPPYYIKKPWAQDDHLRVIPRRDEYLMGLTLPLPLVGPTYTSLSVYLLCVV